MNKLTAPMIGDGSLVVLCIAHEQKTTHGRGSILTTLSVARDSDHSETVCFTDVAFENMMRDAG
jgi:hypothetical protein